MLNLIDRLPSTSHYIAALADDEQLVARSADAEPPARPPRLTEWSPEVQALAVAVDRLGELIRALVAQAGRKPPKIARYPRPVTAAERARNQLRLDKHHALVARVLPGREPQ